MAKIGLSDFRYGVATEAANGTITYATPKKPGKAISFNFDPTKSDASLFADDVLAEHDSSVTGGTCTMGIDREDATTYAELLGHTVTEGEVVSNTNASQRFSLTALTSTAQHSSQRSNSVSQARRTTPAANPSSLVPTSSKAS